MGLVGEGNPISNTGAAAPARQPTRSEISTNTRENRVNWLFSGVLLGSASWLLVLAVIFAVNGAWIVVGALLVGLFGCLLPVWLAGRRLR